MLLSMLSGDLVHEEKSVPGTQQFSSAMQGKMDLAWSITTLPCKARWALPGQAAAKAAQKRASIVNLLSGACVGHRTALSRPNGAHPCRCECAAPGVLA